jgi:hypothetical protein
MTDIEDRNGEVAVSHFILQCTKNFQINFAFVTGRLGTEAPFPISGIKRSIKMKRILKACAAMAVTFSATCAVAAPADVRQCQLLVNRLSQKSAEFVKVNADGKASGQAPNVYLVNFYQGIGKKDAALGNIANEVWTLRTDMASRNCSQADAFAY